MSPEALAGWVLGVLDASDDSPTPEAIAKLRHNCEVVMYGAPQAKAPAPSRTPKGKPGKPITREQLLRVARGPMGGPPIPPDLPEVTQGDQ